MSWGSIINYQWSMITRVPPGACVQFNSTVWRACTRMRRPFGPVVGAYRIRPSRRLRRVFIDDCIRAPGRPGTIWGVCDTPLHGRGWGGGMGVGGFNYQLSMITRVPVPHAGTRINNSTIQRINNSTPGLPPGLSSGGPTGRAHPGTRINNSTIQQFNNSTLLDPHFLHG